jgi:ribosomal protein S19
MSRSQWKLSYFSKSIWRKIVLLKKKDFLRTKKIIFDRSSSIPECFSFYFLRIHKGKRFRRLFIHMYNVGFKFGEFSFTRKPFHFPLKKSLKRKNQFFKK